MVTKRRKFTPQFKVEIVIEALSGKCSQAELCRQHNICKEQLTRWKRHFLDNADTLFESADKQTNAYQKRIILLEQLVGKLTLELDIQKKASTWLD